MLQELRRPITTTDNTFHIFGTNFDVELFNHFLLSSLQGNMKFSHAEDTGNQKSVKMCKASKVLALKNGCRVIIIRNLPNDLVNGLIGKVTKITETEIDVQVQEDNQLQHGLQGKTFTLEKINFSVHDITGNIVANRIQYPIKLGYASTVDKAQGRTIESLVVKCYNFWKPAQMGVTIGQSTCKEGLQVQNFNMNAATLKHPQEVSNFYETRGKGMQQTMSCCRTKVQNAVQQHQFQFHIHPQVQVQLKG